MCVCMLAYSSLLPNRIREVKKQDLKVIDVDGSYLARKRQKLQDSGIATAPLDLPSVPPSGWESVSTINYKTFADKIPRMTPGIMACELTARYSNFNLLLHC